MKKANDGNDDDIADLLPANSGDGQEHVPLTPVKPQAPKQKFQLCGGLCALISAHLSYLCFAYPKCCGCFACSLSFLIVTVLIVNTINPTLQFGIVPHDWTTVSSAYELDIAKVDHWCLGGGNEGCRCEDPLVPASRVELRSWTEAFKENKQQIARYMDDPLLMADLDVAIIGESAIEEMDGRWMGRRPDDQLKNIGVTFKNHFSKEKGAQVEGCALGIAGDSANNVLWRLLHGEMPDGFNPKIWWIHVGMNDLGRQQCSEEVVVIGVLRIVEEILNKRPKARVVINSLLPMADLRGGTVVTEQDYKDAFNNYRGKRKTPSTATAQYVRKKIDGRDQIVPAPRKKDNDRHQRRLLEQALEAYNATTNDNSELIDILQEELEHEEVFEDIIDYEDIPNTMNRRLEELPKKARKDKYNPTINQEQHQKKKYSFFRNRRMPLWTAIYAINKQLFKFCEKHDRVFFFDATNIFAERQNDGQQRFFTLLSDYISARGHPTEMGYARWEDAMVKVILYHLGEMKKENPELFMKQAEPTGRLPYGNSAGKPENVERVNKRPGKPENVEQINERTGNTENGEQINDRQGKPEDGGRISKRPGKPESGERINERPGKPESGERIKKKPVVYEPERKRAKPDETSEKDENKRNEASDDDAEIEPEQRSVSRPPVTPEYDQGDITEHQADQSTFQQKLPLVEQPGLPRDNGQPDDEKEPSVPPKPKYGAVKQQQRQPQYGTKPKPTSGTVPKQQEKYATMPRQQYGTATKQQSGAGQQLQREVPQQLPQDGAVPREDAQSAGQEPAVTIQGTEPGYSQVPATFGVPPQGSQMTGGTVKPPPPATESTEGGETQVDDAEDETEEGENDIEVEEGEHDDVDKGVTEGISEKVDDEGDDDDEGTE